jgi:hypothetical protein
MIKQYEIGVTKLVYSGSKSIFFKALHKWIKTLKRWINISFLMGLGKSINLHSGMKTEWWQSGPYSKWKQGIKNQIGDKK